MAEENNTLGKIKELENLAAKILDLKKTTRPRRPIVLEFCGTPKSGKTSCLSSLNLFLKRNGFATRLLTERADICPIQDKFNPMFNIWTSNSTIAELVATFTEHGKSLDVIICDRGIFDALCWFEWLLDHDHMKKVDYDTLTNYMTTPKLRSMIDLVCLLKASPEVAMKREYATLLTRKHGSVMNPSVLTEYNKAIDKTTTKYNERFRCVRTIDTSNLLQNDVSYQVTKDVLETLYDIIIEKVGYFNRKDLQKFESQSYWNYSEFKTVPQIFYGPRDQVEENTSRVQPVPVLVITNKARDIVFVVKKKAQSLRYESPEKDKLLVYIGGHIRKEDNIEGHDENILSIASAALSREVQEELSISLSFKDNNPLCIWVKTNKRSQAHMAMVYLYEEEDFDYLSYRLDEFEFIQKTGKSKSGRFTPIADLRAKEMEDWSKIILAQKVGGINLYQPMLFDKLK